MNRRLKIFLAVVVVFILLTLTVSAGLVDVLDFVPIPGLRAAVKSAMEISQNFLTNATYATIISILINTILPLMFPDGILWNPTIVGPGANSAVVGIIKTFMIIFQPILVLWIAIIGIYLLFMTGSPAGRVRAKVMFWKAIFAMILFSLSMPLFQILLDLSKALASTILSLGGINPLQNMELGVINLLTPIFSFLSISLLVPGAVSSADKLRTLITVTIVFSFLLAFAVPLVLMLRYFVLTILAVLFPFALLFYFVDVPFIPFRGIGEKLVRLTIMWTFTQVVMALVMVGVGSVAGNLFWNWSPFSAAIVSGLGIFLIAAAPLMMTGLMKWIGAIMVMFGMTFGPGIGSLMIWTGMMLMGAGPLTSMSIPGIHAMLWGFRPAGTVSPLYQPGTDISWRPPGGGPGGPGGFGGLGGSGPEPTPKGQVGEEVKPTAPQPRILGEMAEKPLSIKTARENIRIGEENLELSKPLTGKEKAGYLEAARKNFDRAVDELRRISAKDVAPEQLAGTYFRLGQGYEKVGNLSGAIEAYQIANGIKPDARYLKALGEVYAKRG